MMGLDRVSWWWVSWVFTASGSPQVPAVSESDGN